MATTERSITPEQIRALRSEAARAGDVYQIAICDVALEPGATALTQAQIQAGERDYSGGGLPVDQQREINSMTHEEAVARCVEAIRAAEAQR